MAITRDFSPNSDFNSSVNSELSSNKMVTKARMNSNASSSLGLSKLMIESHDWAE